MSIPIEGGIAAAKAGFELIKSVRELLKKDKLDVSDVNMEWSPKMRRPVKTQNPFKGELSHGFVAQVVH